MQFSQCYFLAVFLTTPTKLSPLLQRFCKLFFVVVFCLCLVLLVKFSFIPKLGFPSVCLWLYVPRVSSSFQPRQAQYEVGCARIGRHPGDQTGQTHEGWESKGGTNQAPLGDPEGLWGPWHWQEGWKLLDFFMKKYGNVMALKKPGRSSFFRFLRQRLEFDLEDWKLP